MNWFLFAFGSMVVFLCNPSFNGMHTMARLWHFPYQLFHLMFLCMHVYQMIYFTIHKVHLSWRVKLVYLASKRYFKLTPKQLLIPWTVSRIIVFVVFSIHNLIVRFSRISKSCWTLQPVINIFCTFPFVTTTLHCWQGEFKYFTIVDSWWSETMEYRS